MGYKYTLYLIGRKKCRNLWKKKHIIMLIQSTIQRLTDFALTLCQNSMIHSPFSGKNQDKNTSVEILVFSENLHDIFSLVPSEQQHKWKKALHIHVCPKMLSVVFFAATTNNYFFTKNGRWIVVLIKKNRIQKKSILSPQKNLPITR